MAPSATGPKAKLVQQCKEAGADLLISEGPTPPINAASSGDTYQSGTHTPAPSKRKAMKSAGQPPMKAMKGAAKGPMKAVKAGKKAGHAMKGKSSKTSRAIKKPKGRTAMKKAADRKGQSSDVKKRNGAAAAVGDGDPSTSANSTAVDHPGLWVHSRCPYQHFHVRGCYMGASVRVPKQRAGSRCGGWVLWGEGLVSV